MQKKIFNDEIASKFVNRLSLLKDIPPSSILGLRGIEREGLRVDINGYLSKKKHPEALGAPLTHPQLTTDYSEALLEFITPPKSSLSKVFECLQELHCFVAENLDEELVWPFSMPPKLPKDDKIPIARYGKSNLGRYKYIYRLGLAARYGRTMQCISGIHFNYSIDDVLWKRIYEQLFPKEPFIAFCSSGYLSLMRNFEHFGWLLLYLFGASPALHPSFLQGQKKSLELIYRDSDTLIAPQATSLRMSDLGYRNCVLQAHLRPRYDSLDSYLKGLVWAVSTPHPPYQHVGIRDISGNWLQLNSNLLQTENELYASIRPKRTTHTEERPINALSRQGIEYIEARTLDLDPFDPFGISRSTAYFMEAFLTMCALMPTPIEDTRITDDRNFCSVARIGRTPGLKLKHCVKNDITLYDWGHSLLDQVEAVAERLDSNRASGNIYRKSVAHQRNKLNDVNMTPSAQVLIYLEKKRCSFIEFGMSQAMNFSMTLKREGCSDETRRRMRKLALKSIKMQKQLENDPYAVEFDQYVTTLSGAI